MYGLYFVFMLCSYPDFFAPRRSDAYEEVAHGSRARAATTLVLASLGAAWTSEMLVGAAQATGSALGMSDLFLGVLPS